MRASVLRPVARSVALLGIACAGGILFVACANGTEGGVGPGGTTADSGSGGDDDATTGRDGSTSGTDSGSGSDTGSEDAGVDSGPSCIDDDAGCSTGNPGLCADGNHHCEADGGSVCVPLYTTQSCYTGGATTRSTGICHDGSQSCVGALGSCDDEQLPDTKENCFDSLDNDCDGLINQGCPVSVSLGTPRTLPGAGGGGGASNPISCPAGAFVTRVDSWFDDDDAKASGVSIYCATPSLGLGAVAGSYKVTLAANTPAPYGISHGTHAPNIERTDDCGISGLTAITYMLGYSDNFVEAQGHHCSASPVTLAADNTITFSFTAQSYSNGTFNEYSDPPPGAFFDRDCNDGENPRNQVVVGYSIHDGAYLDNITPICAPLNVNYSAGTPDP